MDGADTSRGWPSASRRLFLLHWLGGTLLALGGSVLGGVAAYEGYAGWSERNLTKLNAGVSRAYYPASERSAKSPPPASHGEEPALFVASAPAPDGPASQSVPLTISIPAIDLQSEVVELGTQLVDGQFVWKTADHSVGHHLGTAMPGAIGNAVFSGHISSPLSHEGHVFRRLPDLSQKLGSDVAIAMEGGQEYHYRVVGTEVVTPADVWVMAPTTTPILTMLTCVPDGVYTHRLVVTSKLVSAD